MLGRFHTLPLSGETMRNRSSSIASGPRRSLPTSSSSVGTHYAGLPRNLGFWQCRKNTAFSRRSRPWRQDSLLQWYSQPGKPKYHLKKSFGPWKKELLGCPFFPELIARRKRGHMPQENWTPSSWGLSVTRWAAPQDSMIFSTRHHPLWSIRLPPWSSQHGRRRQLVLHGSGNIRCLWFVRNILLQATHGGNLYSHGGLVFPSILALRRVTTWYPPSAKMAWDSSPGLARLTEPSVGWKTHWVGGGFPQNSFKTSHGTASVSSFQTVHSNLESPEIRGGTWATGWQNQQLMFTPGRSAMWWLRYGTRWQTTSRGDLHGRTDGSGRPQSPWLGGLALGWAIPIKEEREGLPLQRVYGGRLHSHFSA